MTIEQKKISLINWITNIQDENVIDEISKIQELSLSSLPDSIVKLLHIADSEPEENLTKHTSSRDILK
jgi:hypothetical protein